MVEAKASGRDIKIPKTVELAKLLRSDLVTLAVMEENTDALKKKLTELQKQLVGTGISAELMTLWPNDIEDSPLLPTGTSYRVRIL